MRGFIAFRNILKAWLLLAGICGVLALAGWQLGGVRVLSLFVFAGLLLVGGAYWSFDRVVLGMVGARELPVGEAPLLHSTVERLAAIAGSRSRGSISFRTGCRARSRRDEARGRRRSR